MLVTPTVAILCMQFDVKSNEVEMNASLNGYCFEKWTFSRMKERKGKSQILAYEDLMFPDEDGCPETYAQYAHLFPCGYFKSFPA